MPQQIQDDTPRGIARHTPYLQYKVELPFNAPQFEGLPHLRLEKVNNFSMFLNLAFISTLPQRNIKWGLAVMEYAKKT
jgi:hypothetical protein